MPKPMRPTPRVPGTAAPRPLHRRLARACAAAHVLALAAGCMEPSVEWGAIELVPAAEGRLVVDAAGRRDFAAPPADPPNFPSVTACPGSRRVAWRDAREVYAVWWEPDAAGRATLLAARSDDGGVRWTPPVAADSLDRGARGCDRPPPAIAVDSATGHVHVVYFLDAPEGPGVFFTHSMERGALFHEPVAIVYGERPSSASVAAAGELVAVAYEDPNSAQTAIGLALSRTAGHIFQERLPVSGVGGTASAPQVAAAGRRVVVAWRQRARNTDGPGVMHVRAGSLR